MLLWASRRSSRRHRSASGWKPTRPGLTRSSRPRGSCGASFAALYATIQIRTIATSMGYDSQFLLLEPNNQRDARKRPDANLWKAAEEKELATLWGKEAFELVARPSEHEYDPLPLQPTVCLQAKGQGWGLRPWSTQGPMRSHGKPPVRLRVRGSDTGVRPNCQAVDCKDHGSNSSGGAL